MLSQAISESAIFSLGRTVATPHALQALAQQGITPLSLLKRHASGNWGDVPPDDAQANHVALKSGSRLFSSYHLGPDDRIWIITEADRSVRRLLSPSEY
jgi:hypothetical protein